MISTTTMDRYLLNKFKYLSKFVLKKGTILDLGCGKINFSLFLPLTVTYFGFDKNISEYSNKIIKCDISKKIPFKGKVDMVIILNVLEYIKNYDFVIEQAKQKLSSDGQIMIGIYNATNIINRFSKKTGSMIHFLNEKNIRCHFKNFKLVKKIFVGGRKPAWLPFNLRNLLAQMWPSLFASTIIFIFKK